MADSSSSRDTAIEARSDKPVLRSIPPASTPRSDSNAHEWNLHDLVTGGAGYIGSHVVRALRHSGREVVVLDDLSTGVAGKVPADVPLVEASVMDADALTATIERYHVDGVVHLAAKKAVEDSVRQPLWYYEENVEGFRRLLDAMRRADVQRLVLSSSAAVYGTPDADLAREDHPCGRVNPYGQTKLVCEWLAAAGPLLHHRGDYVQAIQLLEPAAQRDNYALQFLGWSLLEQGLQSEDEDLVRRGTQTLVTALERWASNNHDDGDRTGWVRQVQRLARLRGQLREPVLELIDFANRSSGWTHVSYDEVLAANGDGHRTSA